MERNSEEVKEWPSIREWDTGRERSVWSWGECSHTLDYPSNEASRCHCFTTWRKWEKSRFHCVAHVFPAARLASALSLLSSFPIKLSHRHFVLCCNSKLLWPQSPFGSSLLPSIAFGKNECNSLMIISHIKLLCSHHHKWWDLKKSCMSHLISFLPLPLSKASLFFHCTILKVPQQKFLVSVETSSWKLLALNLHFFCLQIFICNLTFAGFPALAFCSKFDSSSIGFCLVP